MVDLVAWHWKLYNVQTPIFQISAPSALCRTLRLHQRLRIPVMVVIKFIISSTDGTVSVLLQLSKTQLLIEGRV